MNRNFYLLAQGQFISNIGTQMAVMGTVFWLKQATNSATLIGLLLAFSALPTLLLGPFGGTVADRYPRRNILILSDALSGLLVGILTYLVWAKPVGLSNLVVSIFAVNQGLACVNAFFLPAIAAIVPDVVIPEKVDSAISWSQSLGFLSMMVGQGVSGILLTWVAPYILFSIDAVSYMFAAVGESFVVIPLASKESSPPPNSPLMKFLHETWEGIEYVWTRRGIRAMFLTAISLNVFVAPLFVLLPFYATNILHRSMGWYGYLLAAWSLGSLVGYALTGLIRFEKLPLIALKAALCCLSVLLLTCSWVTHPGMAVIWLSVMGLLGAGISLYVLRALQKVTEPYARGRVLGLWFTLTQGLTPLAMGLAGWMADYAHGNIGSILNVCGIAALFISLKACFNQELSEFLAFQGLSRRESSCGV